MSDERPRHKRVLRDAVTFVVCLIVLLAAMLVGTTMIVKVVAVLR